MGSNFSPDNQLTTARKLQLAIFGLLLVLIIGVIGFMILEGLSPIDALYMTVITLSTVGFGEVSPLHPAGRLFVIFLILFGVMLTGFFASIIGQMIIEGQFREIYGRRKMEKKIDKMHDHIIIAGYGRVGRHVALEFKKKHVDFIVIEKDESMFTNLEKDGILFIQGEATDDDILRDAGIERAKTFVTTLPDEAQNVYLTLTARDMNRNLLIIARADYEEGEKKLKRAGADQVVTPHVLGGVRMAMASLRPNVVDFMKTTSLGQGGLSIEELRIPENCTFAGKTLVGSNLKND
ncbi:MAG: potassium channel protein, partial [Calditrichaeota bacterium]